MEKRFVSIVVDDDQHESPLEYSDYQLISFNTRHTNFGNPEELGWFKDGPNPTPKLQELMDQNLAFILHYFEHGQCCWQLADAPHIAGTDCPWDSVSVAGLLIFTGESKNAPAEDKRVDRAKGICESYTDWCNGNIFCYDIEDEDGNIIDSCGGHYGTDAAEEALREAMYPTPEDVVYELDPSDSNFLQSLPTEPEP